MVYNIQDYYRKYPNLLVQAVKFFEINNMIDENSTKRPRTISEFLSHYHRNHSPCEDYPQPHAVNSLLRRLCEFNMLTFVGNRFGGDEANSYLCVSKIDELTRLKYPDETLQRHLNCMAYGLPIVYDTYKASVLPIVVGMANGDQDIGTCFVVSPSVLVTCWHCIEAARTISIRGVDPEQLKLSKIFRSKDRNLDLAMICFQNDHLKALPSLMFARSEVLTNILAMGYPRIPGFQSHLAAEKGVVVSSLSASVGSITSNPFEIWSKQKLLLISARVTGGYSGGPILGENAQCYGVIARKSDMEAGSAADNLGYGVAIPAEIVQRFLDGPVTETEFREEAVDQTIEYVPFT